MLANILPPTPAIFTESSYVIDVKVEQLEKQLVPNDVTERGILIDGKSEQLRKQLPPNDFTEDRSLNVIDVKVEQLEKQPSPNDVTKFPNVTDTNFRLSLL